MKVCWVITAYVRYGIGFPLETCLYFAQQSPTVDRQLGGRNQKFKLLPLLGISCSFLDFLCIYTNFGFDDWFLVSISWYTYFYLFYIHSYWYFALKISMLLYRIVVENLTDVWVWVLRWERGVSGKKWIVYPPGDCHTSELPQIVPAVFVYISKTIMFSHTNKQVFPILLP